VPTEDSYPKPINSGYVFRNNQPQTIGGPIIIAKLLIFMDLKRQERGNFFKKKRKKESHEHF
jgi:hypothetical protein